MARRLGISLLIGLALSGCGGQVASPGTSTEAPAPTASPTGASIEPSAAAESPDASTSTATPAPGGIAVDSIAHVVTDGLRVRSAPGVGAQSKLLAPLLNTGRLVFVVAGPVDASGFQWYQVQPISAPDEFEDLPFGWVAAAGKDDEPWLVAAPVVCPASPSDYRSFVALRSLGLACFGNDDMTFTARIASPEATCGVEPGWAIEPEWLLSTCPQGLLYLADLVRSDYETRDAIFDPGLDISGLHPGIEPEGWLTVEVTGHHDDPAARTCHGISTESGVEVPLAPEEIVLSCRTQFVITSFRLVSGS